MHWIMILGLVVVFTVLAVLAGLTPRKGRPVEKTKLVHAARVALVLAVLLVAGLVWYGRPG